MTDSLEQFSRSADFRLQQPRLFPRIASDHGSAIAADRPKLVIPLTLRPIGQLGAETSLMAIHLHPSVGELTARVSDLNQFRLEARATPDVRQAPDASSGGAMLGDRLGEAYNEDAFHYLLSVEFKRSERSKRPFLLFLLDLEEESGTTRDITPQVAVTLFSCLARCLRETDYVGWYRQGRVVGVVLTQFKKVHGTEISHVVGQKVRDALRGSLTSEAFDHLKVRAYQRPPSLMGRD